MARTMDSAHHTVTRKASDWKEPLGRIGLVGQGVVATIVGLLAIRIAMGEKEQDPSGEGAVAWLAQQPFGKFLLVALTVALFALAIWRVLCAWMGDSAQGSDATHRAKYAVLAVIYFSLAVTTLSMTISNWTGDAAASGGGSGSDQKSKEAASTMFDLPAGRWLVGLLGVGIIGYAGFSFYKQVLQRHFAERLDADEQSWIVRLGMVGYTARALVFAVVGWFFLQAAIAYRPEEAAGPSGALLELAGTSWGPLLLWAIALGLFAYGIFCIAESRYRTAA